MTSHQQRKREKFRRELDEFCALIGRRVEKENYQPVADLYHYTSVDAAADIISDRRFRLSGLSALRQSDRGEIEYGIGVLREGLTNAPTASHRQRALIDRLLFAFTFEKFTDAFDCFIGSFTRSPEDPEMWESYGRSGSGVAIGIRSEFFRIGDPVPNSTNFVLQPVIYGPEDLLERLRKILSLTLPKVDVILSCATTPSRMEEAYVTIASQLMASTLVPHSMIAKHPSFRHEVEVRAVHVSDARARNQKPRERYRYVSITPDDIAASYCGSHTDDSRLKALWRSNGVSADIRRAQCFP